MKKSNVFTMFILTIFIIMATILMGIEKIPSLAKSEEEFEKQEIVNDKITEDKNISDEAIDETKKELPVKEIAMNETLFVGDSRTVGLMEYSGITEAIYFCAEGMNIFNIYDNQISVPNIGKVTLIELLDNRDFKKIYIMLGLNELGYEFDKIMEKYQELVLFIKEKEQATDIILLGNLHVTQTRSESDEIYNNEAINRLNKAIAELADNNSIYYLDSNVLFDDANGALNQDKSSDNTHLYAKYYEEWGKWIKEKTILLVQGE